MADIGISLFLHFQMAKELIAYPRHNVIHAALSLDVALSIDFANITFSQALYNTQKVQSDQSS